MGKNLEKFMWQVMQYLGAGTLHNREDGTLVYSAPCTCGDPYCGDDMKSSRFLPLSRGS